MRPITHIISIFIATAILSGCAIGHQSYKRNCQPDLGGSYTMVCNDGDSLVKYDLNLATNVWIENIYNIDTAGIARTITSLCNHGFNHMWTDACPDALKVNETICRPNGMVITHNFSDWDHMDTVIVTGTNPCWDVYMASYH